MMVITEAAPGLIPHSAVVPGSRRRRVISQPIRLQATTTDSTPAVKSSQWLKDVAHDRQRHHAGDHAADDALRHDEGGQGKAHLAAAGGNDDSRDQGTQHQRGRRVQPQQDGADADRQDNEQPSIVTLAPSLLMNYWANSSASPFILRMVSISSTAAAASRASSVPRSTSETLGLPLRKAG